MTPSPKTLGVVMVSLHTSPLAQPGQGDAGGMNVYVRHLAITLATGGHPVWVLTRRDRAGQGVQDLPVPAVPGAARARVVPVGAGPATTVPKEELPRWVDDFAEAAPAALSAAGGCHGSDCRWVVHSHYWLSGLAGLSVAADLEAPIVHTMHTMAAVKNARDARSSEPETRESAERDELIGHYGAEPARITVVPPGVDTAVFNPDGPRRWPGHPEGVKVLFAGRIQGHKGPQVAIRAVGLVNGRSGSGPGVSLHLTGATSGSDGLDLARLRGQAGLGERCTVSGPVSAEDLAAMYRAADVVVVPSFSESFGLVALEAQACGTPVMAHRVGGLTYAVADGQTGRLVDGLDPETWAEELERIAADLPAWRLQGPAAARRAHEFGWEAMAARLSAAYEGL